MRAIVVVLLFVVCASAAVEPRGGDATEEYLQIYQAIQRADELLQRADLAGARATYEAAKAELEGFAVRHPGWNERVVQFRRNYIAQQLGALPPSGREPAPAGPIVTPAGTIAADEAKTQLTLLREQLRRLSVENESLYSRLQEALSARPSAVDPQELARADERIRTLQKENDLLKVALQKAERPPEASSPEASPASEELKRNLAAAKEQLRRQADQIETLEREKEVAGVSRPRSAIGVPTSGTPGDGLQQELAEQRARNEILMAEKRILESHVAELASRQGAEIRARTEELERDLAVAREDARRKEAELARLETELRSLRERSVLQDRRNQDLQQEVRGLRSSLVTARSEPAVNNLLERVKTLEQERDALRRRVEAFQTELTTRSAASAVGPASVGPKGPMRGDQPIQASLPAGVLTRRAEDAGTDRLVAEAQLAATSGRWAEAEAAYRQALGRSGRDLALLSGLGATLLAQNRVTEAESTLQAVVAARPQDPAAVLMLGVVRIRQRRDDDALMLLSRAAQLDPSSPEAHCFLGQVLERKGLADAAEKTLRRAVELQPRYADAHRALARLYAFRQPPSLDLARRHHALAVDAGAASDTQVEQLLRSGPGPLPSGVR